MKKKLLAAALALCMVFGSAAALPEGVFSDSASITASAATSGKFEYEVLDDGTVSIIKYNGEEANINIPSNIKGKAVTCIGEKAFQENENIKSVVLPSTLKKINGSSFDGAFSECISLTEIVIPANVTYIGCCAFKECTGLKKVTFKTGAKKEIDDEAFKSCTNLKELDLGESVIAIGGSAFAGCEELKGKKVGNTYKLVIPDSVTRLYYDYYNGPDPGYNSSAFSGCTSLEEVVIGKGVKEIGGNAFLGCTKLGKVTIGSNVTDIDCSAFKECFSECKSAASVIIPAKVKYIGREAFENCAKLQTVTFEDGAEKYIDNFAFQNCTSLKNVNFGVSVTTIADSSFYGCTALEKLVIPDSVTKLGTGNTSWTYNGAFQGCTNLKEVKLGNGITEVSYNTFLDCTSLKSVTFGVNIKKIGSSAFENCSSLEKVVLMPKTTTIEEQAFANCTSLKTAILTGVKQLVGGLHNYNGSFYNCTKLSTVVMSEGDIKKIGDYAFVGCESLKTLTIPKSADTLGEGIYGYDEYDNAYSGITVRGVKDSKAQKYAKDNGFKFVAIAKHTCNYEKVVVPSTCTEKGYTVNVCKICGKVKETNTVKAAGHKWSDWKVVKTATCAATGLKTHYCTVCGKYETSTIAKTNNHNFSTWKTTKKATCTAAGSKTRTCSVCKKTETAAIAKLGHSYKTTVVKPTCSAKGYTLHKCTKCGYSYKDKYTNTVAHKFSNWTTTKKATCKADGTQTRKCSVCGKTETKTIKATGHKVTNWTTKSFNVDKGTSTQTGKCTHCGKVQTRTVNNAVVRYAGANRYDTAAMLSKASHKTTSDTVIIADAMTFQDALIAVPLAKAYNAPLLLANQNTVTKQTEAELARLKAKKVIIVNTYNVLKKSMIYVLNKKYSTQTIGGRNCFETSKKVAEALQAKTKKAPTDVFFTTNKAFADALSISPVAALKGAPILYVDPSKKTLDSNILAYLNKVKGSIKNVYIVGGKVAVPAAIENSIKKALPKKNVKRFDGAQRYETCVMINNYFASLLNSKTVCVAKGLDFPDALAGGVFAANQKAPLLLADTALRDAQKSFLKDKKPNKLYIFGGTVAVPDKLAKEVAKMSV